MAIAPPVVARGHRWSSASTPSTRIVRNQFGSAVGEPGPRPFSNATARHRRRAGHGPVRRGAGPGGLPRLGLVPALWNIFYGSFHFVVTVAVMILLYRRAPVPLPPLAHHPRLHHGARARRLQPLPADAAPPARRLRRRSAGAACSTGSSTRWPTSAGCGRSTPAGCSRSPTSTRPCRACTWPGPLWCTLAIVAGAAAALEPRRALRLPVVTLFAIVVTANHYWLDGVGGLIALVLGVAWSRSASLA